MPDADPAGLVGALVGGARRAGHRMVLHSGWSAGAPAVVIPLFADQFFWGGRVAALAAGAPPIPRERLTDARLADALTDALRRRHGARRIAQALAAEDGVAAAVDLLEARL